MISINIGIFEKEGTLKRDFEMIINLKTQFGWENEIKNLVQLRCFTC